MDHTWTIHGPHGLRLAGKGNEHYCAGDMVRVAVVIERQEDGDMAVVVTVMD
ncbi:MAG: hypothetical protein M0T84_07130 [Betaproteobacteria bacterium]|nr:hypothetical protein [Betaproteobacteria bacterium]